MAARAEDPRYRCTDREHSHKRPGGPSPHRVIKACRERKSFNNPRRQRSDSVAIDVRANIGQTLEPEGGSMAKATVFVDDAVLGHLPPVCAKTGVDTWDHLVMTVPVGGSEGLGIAWLLVLAGPIGWLGLFIYAVARRVETLTVKLPYCDAAYNELTRHRRIRRNTGLAVIMLFVIAILVAIARTYTARAAAVALAVVAVGLLVTFVAETFRVRRAAVQVDLDGSRRWVTLSRISDGLAEAITTSRADRPRIEIGQT